MDKEIKNIPHGSGLWALTSTARNKVPRKAIILISLLWRTAAKSWSCLRFAQFYRQQISRNSQVTRIKTIQCRMSKRNMGQSQKYLVSASSWFLERSFRWEQGNKRSNAWVLSRQTTTKTTTTILYIGYERTTPEYMVSWAGLVRNSLSILAILVSNRVWLFHYSLNWALFSGFWETGSTLSPGLPEMAGSWAWPLQVARAKLIFLFVSSSPAPFAKCPFSSWSLTLWSLTNTVKK